MPNHDDMDAPVTLRTVRAFEQKVDLRLEKVEQRFEKVDQQFEKVEQQFAEVREQFVEVKTELAALRRDVAQLPVDLARHANAISEQLRSDIRALRDVEPGSTAELQTLPRRVAKLEERVFAPSPPAARAGRKRS